MYNLAYWASAHELSFCFPSTEIVVHTCLRRITVPWCFHSVHTTYLATTPGWLPHTCGPTTKTLALHMCIQASELTRLLNHTQRTEPQTQQLQHTLTSLTHHTTSTGRFT
ncbi:hypothetical protein CSKR_200981 [Clonorchis sinensis]|uniref:Uncharacterized protein n=1 Tax=Clonorchis sinensis TaxID=79923 RepID=A0A8T1MK59_CLOSI|nr:hypothetical protein CSKR_200981 [Clonorchis sinensis]